MLRRLRAPAWRLPARSAADLSIAAAAMGAVLVVGYFALGDPDIQDLAYQVPEMLAAVAVAAGIVIHRPADRRPWLLLVAGLLATTAGDWTWVVLDRVYGVEPFPSVADLFYLTGIALYGLAVLWLVRGRIPDGDRAGVLDAMIVAVGVGLLSWTFLMAPIVADPDAVFVEIAVALVYPVLDILVLGVLVRVLLAPGEREVSLTLLIGALVALLASDFPYAILALVDGYATGDLVEAGWLASGVLFAAAALHPSMRTVATPVEAAEETRLSGWRLLMLAAASLMAPAVLFIQWMYGLPIDAPVVAGGSVVLFLLVITRLGGVVSDLRSTLRTRQRLEQELEHRAFHDPLTGLANRVLFGDRLERALAQREETVAVLFLDLDDFKTINDTHGHQAGDELLIAVADALRRSVRPEDTVARLGGDEFAVLVERRATEGVARQLADRLLAHLREPVRVAGRDRTVGASVGISLGRAGTATAEAMMQEADIAMYVAKGEGKGGASVFATATHHRVVKTIGLRDDLDRAIARREFVIHYEPIVDLGSGDLAGVEALVRWRHPERGLVQPDEFIPLAESTGAIVPLGEWILAEACRRAAAWTASGFLGEHRFLSINLSAVQLTYPGFVPSVAEALARSAVAPERLVIEVTESASADVDAVADALTELAALGLRLAIDDFGTGFASLGRLLRSPFEFIKIDRSQVAHIDGSDRADAVVTGITDLARRLGAATIAEGVERPEQLTRLRQMGCAYGQGFLFSPALPARQLEALLRSADPWTAVPAALVPRRAPQG